MKIKVMCFKNITVVGSGVLGYQIAFQTAFHGFKVTLYDINDDVLEKAKAKFTNLSEAYKHDLKMQQPSKYKQHPITCLTFLIWPSQLKMLI